MGSTGYILALPGPAVRPATLSPLPGPIPSFTTAFQRPQQSQRLAVPWAAQEGKTATSRVQPGRRGPGGRGS